MFDDTQSAFAFDVHLPETNPHGSLQRSASFFRVLASSLRSSASFCYLIEAFWQSEMFASSLFLGLSTPEQSDFLAPVLQLAFLVGVSLTIGVRKTFRFFFQRQKLKGTIPFLGGIALVLLGRTFIGLVVEIFGFVNLFGCVINFHYFWVKFPHFHFSENAPPQNFEASVFSSFHVFARRHLFSVVPQLA